MVGKVSFKFHSLELGPTVSGSFSNLYVILFLPLELYGSYQEGLKEYFGSYSPPKVPKFQTIHKLYLIKT